MRKRQHALGKQMWILSTFIFSFRCFCHNESEVAWIGKQTLHYIMMCFKHSSELNTVKIPSCQVCLSTNISNPPQVSFAASDSTKNDNKPIQRPGWLLKNHVTKLPHFLEVQRIYTNKSNLGNSMFLLLYWQAVCNIFSLISTPYHPFFLETWDILFHEWF